MYRIGVDVGGTNTDAAVLDITASHLPSRGVLASSKSPTTPNITDGLQKSIEDVLEKSKISKFRLLGINIGTTHFVNAVVEADEKKLSKVAVVRLCGPYTRQLPPFSDFPPHLTRILKGGVFYLSGGFDIDGTEISPINLDQIKEVVQTITQNGVSTVAIVGVFSPGDHSGQQEERCKSVMLEHNPSLEITCSRSIGPLGLLERENATILNAAITPVAKKIINGFKRAMSRLQLTCPVYLTQNDGTLTDMNTASQFPIRTFASGPTNSTMGAAFLAGLDKSRLLTDAEKASAPQVIVVDIGGTTTDLCALLPSGFPRQAPGFVEVGGVKTAFSMPEVSSIGLGGGSRIGTDSATDEVTIGPDSVGHLISDQAMVFGGKVMTTTDIAVASGMTQIGNAGLVADIPPKMLETARQKINKMLKDAIEEMKVSPAPVTLLLVGGGSILAMDEIEGVESCIRPPHHSSANAVGAAIAKISYEVDVIEALDGRDEKAVVAGACERAIQEAIRKGASTNDVEVVAIDKIALQYATNRATRIIVKAVGSLEVPQSLTPPETPAASPIIPVSEELHEDVKEPEKEVGQSMKQELQQSATKPSTYIDIASYRPDVRNGVWYLSEVDLEFIASGTGVLGTGGGGSSYHAYLASLDCLRTAGPGKMRVISPSALQDSELVSFGSWYGAPSVANERIPAGTEIQTAIDTVNRIMGLTEFQALIADEIGGGNGLAAFPVGSQYDRPIVDADGMGRAYPTMEHSTIYINGYPITPCAISDASGNVSVIMSAESNSQIEKMLRSTSVELGSGVAVAARPLPGSVIKEYAVPNTVSQSWYIGRAIHLARRTKSSYVKAILDSTPGRLLFSGKIIDVKRDVEDGYTMGRCVLAPLSNDEKDGKDDSDSFTDRDSREIDESRYLVVPFQNEYLYAAYTDAGGMIETEVLCSVPDLISIIGQDGEAIGSEALRFGLKVNVIGMPAHPLWTKTEDGLRVGGPEGFGLTMRWTSVGEYRVPRSVIEDFNT